MIQPCLQRPGDEILMKEKAVISELRREVDGKEGKFVKVTGRAKNNSHDRGKKTKTGKSNHDRPFSSGNSKLKSDVSSSGVSPTSGDQDIRRSGGQEIRRSGGQVIMRSSGVSPHQSRSRSADPHSQSQWLLRRHDRDVPDSCHHPRDSWGVSSDTDISDGDSWTLETERHSRSG